LQELFVAFRKPLCNESFLWKLSR